MNRIFILIVALCQIALINAQEAEYVKGDVLVQIERRADIQTVVNRINENSEVTLNLKVDDLVVKRMNIWLLKHDPQISVDQALHTINRDEEILVAQRNHIVRERITIPNDPEFGDQWQYLNNGINGQVAGADIDAPEAWDTVTGGLSAMGDTIVICVVDDGININHADFAGNMWVNKFEIPNNNIDDDNNGYTDDYLGWHVNNGNDNISLDGSHGTPVSGIVGARGDNGIGVAGVNWNVKIMTVVLQGANEANVLAAYAYPLDMRIRYNNSAGSDGAFVVATNSSWGVDFGQPANAPLWCNMYDTLGKYGILNCGATINADENVDIIGDLPTACPSKHLISVTNSNSADIKVTSAGWGTTHIDLAAPGAGTWTTSNNGGYNSFGGTSGATPHVTGAIGLLYAAECPGFILYSKQYPDSASLMCREAILTGEDTLNNLSSFTATSGRLNLYKAVRRVLKFECPETGCPNAFNLKAKSVSDTSADLSWNSFDSITDYTIIFGVNGGLVFDTITTTANTYSVSGLSACTDYIFTVYVNCDGLISDPSNRVFKTDGCCEPPAIVNIDSIEATSIHLSWTSVLAAQSYDLSFKAVGGIGWTTINVDSNYYELGGLDSCSDYEVRVATVCVDSTTDFSQVIAFSTGACLGCDAPFCPSSGDDSSDEWIEGVQIGDLANISGNNNGYALFDTLPIVTYEKDSTYDFTLTPGFGFFPFDEYWKIWIDLDRNGVFNNQEELVFDPGTVSDMDVIGSFTIPSTAKLGNSRMRVSMRFNNEPTQCMEFDFGEVEDYCINIGGDPSSVPTIETEESFVIYPNPSSGVFNIEMKFKQSRNVEFTLFDGVGRIIETKELTSSSINHMIDISQLPSGVYYLQSNADELSKFSKLIKY